MTAPQTSHPSPEELEPAPPWGIGLALMALAYFLMIQFMLGVLFFLIYWVLLEPAQPLEAVLERAATSGRFIGIANGLIYLFILLTVLAALRLWVRQPLGLALRLVPPVRIPLWATPLLALGLGVAIDAVTITMGRPVIPENIAPLLRGYDPLEWISMGFLAVIVAPPTEELLFRGLLYPALAVRVGPMFSIYLVSLIFALFHLLTYGGTADQWFWIAQAFVIGLTLTGLRARTRSLWPPILMHMTLNLYAMAEAIFLLNFRA
ncbi:MAG: CPBP family intramembrane glutamic endopeptidase [Anaerolineae bacterium]|nr:CPBP family intramembrane metalloprotease [Thermoflexus sp.]MDW8065933.1 CPBP family intramembrane glutamic endopeptidase [Anaerolineae bacterium]